MSGDTQPSSHHTVGNFDTEWCDVCGELAPYDGPCPGAEDAGSQTHIYRGSPSDRRES